MTAHEGGRHRDRDFDKAFAQRWGANPSPLLGPVTHPALPMTVSWATALPLATLRYTHAEPLTNASAVTGDATDDFLPPAIAARYALEGLDPTSADSTYRKGMLLGANAPAGVPAADRLPALAVDEVQAVATPRPACHLANLSELRTRLPGYEPSLDYFDSSLPTTDVATPGVSWSQPLKRSRLSCETLALAQTYDVRHNDLATTWRSSSTDAGVYVFETMTGRRKFSAANANRICEWVEYVDRDGDTHYSGLNYHGRPLVEAVLANGEWKFGETLYNADGNVISQRRTAGAARPWTPALGDTRYTYHEETVEPGKVGSVRPWYWARRENVTRIETLPRGGVVEDEVEGTTSLRASRGRYVAFAYEPFFNQVRLVETGSISSGRVDEPTSRTSMVFDYQEAGDASQVQPLLVYAQTWGAGLELKGTGTSLLWDETALQVALLGTDVNGDGALSTRGVPVRIVEEGLNGAREFTFLRWNASGQPARIDSPDGTRTAFTYYRLGDGAAGQRGVTSGATVDPGFAGLLAAVTRTRTRWDGAGPTALGAGCAQLPPEYRFLLQSCGSNLGTQLAGLGLTNEAVAGVTGAATGFTTRFDYNAAGHLREVFQHSGESARITTDTDGREKRSELHAAGGALHSAVVTTRDDFMRATRVARFDATGASLGDVITDYDNEDKPTASCAQVEATSCTTPTSTGVRTSVIYTREGDVFRSIDPEGLVAEYARDGRKWVTTTRLISPDATEGTRQTTFILDDDGNTRRRIYGTQPGSRLEEAMDYDGLNRVTQQTETTGTVWELRYSRRELLTSRKHAAPAPWNESFRYDDFGRTSSVTRNGVVAATFRRTPGVARRPC